LRNHPANEIIQHHDWLPTFLAAAGEPDIVDKLKAGHRIGDKTYEVHIDGYNLLPYLTGREQTSPRRGFIYFSDDGDVLGIRYDNWNYMLDRAFLAIYGQALVAQYLEKFKEFPPRQEAASFAINQAVERLNEYLADRSR
jgi:arylsulfatase A-like enzyme